MDLAEWAWLHIYVTYWTAKCQIREHLQNFPTHYHATLLLYTVMLFVTCNMRLNISHFQAAA